MTPTEQDNELEKLIRNNIHTFADEYLELDECVAALTAYTNKLIRTEKLKLLAEVRERVVGEDVELSSFEIPAHEAEFVISSVTQQNHLRADQRTELAKLEEEL